MQGCLEIVVYVCECEFVNSGEKLGGREEKEREIVDLWQACF